MSKKSPRALWTDRRDRIRRVHPDAAGIDCGAAEHYVAVPPDRDPERVRAFKTFTGDLQRLVQWLQACRVTTVAMEATGVYWIPLYELLEAAGIEAVLVNARHVKHVPGRKSDVSDCEWLQDLHSVGLLRGSFRPAPAIASLRAYLRHRDTLIRQAGIHTQRMQKALIQMNLQLPVVVTDITGMTGLKIVRSIVAGETDPAVLAQHRDHRCAASVATLTAALTGHYRPEYLFILRQNLELFDMCQQQILACDAAIAQWLDTLTAQVAPPARALPPPRPRQKHMGNEPRCDVRAPLFHLTGVDLSQIAAIGPYTALRLVSEIGTDMSRWPTEKHFTSWLTLAPRNRVSGGRLLGSHTQPSANRAAALLRMVSMSVGRTQTALGAYYRRLAARVGKAKAVTATARKLAILVYRSLKDGLIYQDPGAAAYDLQHKTRVVRRLRQRAATLGYELVRLSTTPITDGVVS